MMDIQHKNFCISPDLDKPHPEQGRPGEIKGPDKMLGQFFEVFKVYILSPDNPFSRFPGRESLILGHFIIFDGKIRAHSCKRMDFLYGFTFMGKK